MAQGESHTTSGSTGGFLSDCAAALAAVRNRIEAAERLHGRTPGSVTLVAVSKAQDARAVRALARAGQRRFGESWLGEAIAKMDALRDLNLEWHFIGPIQGNKTRGIATRFDWVHGIDRARIARRLSEQRPEALAPLQVCVQVNVSGEASKSGVPPEEAPELVRYVASLPRLRLRGLMTIPAPDPDAEARRRAFRVLAEIRDRLAQAGHPLDTLSMGMSDDLEEAIGEGATLVRVGGALFGKRATGQDEFEPGLR